jgi:hypothetical protein
MVPKMVPNRTGDKRQATGDRQPFALFVDNV